MRNICNHCENKLGTLGMRSPELEHTAHNANNTCQVIGGIAQRDKHIRDEGIE